MENLTEKEIELVIDAANQFIAKTDYDDRPIMYTKSSDLSEIQNIWGPLCCIKSICELSISQIKKSLLKYIKKTSVNKKEMAETCLSIILKLGDSK